MSQLKKSEMKKKYKYSEREERFSCITQNHRKSEERCERRYSKDIIEKFNLRCKSREQKNFLYLEHCKKIEEIYKVEKKENYSEAYRNRMKNLKRCEICLDAVNFDSLLYCAVCEDGYHCYCLEFPSMNKEEVEDFICDNCENMENQTDKFRQKTMDESYELTIKKNKKRCFSCKEDILDNNFIAPSVKSKFNKNKNFKSIKMDKFNQNHVLRCEYLLEPFKTCLRCKKDFHNECFQNNKENLNNSFSNNNKGTQKFCKICEEGITKAIKTTKISDFFKFEKNKSITNKVKYDQSMNENHSNSTEDIVIFDFEKKNENVSHYPKFLLWKQIAENKLTKLKENLFRALLIKNIDFSDDLVYLDPDCGEQMNNSKLEPGIQKMSSFNKKIFKQFKERTRKGEYPGLEIIEDEIQGFIVRATEDIKKNTLICEYTGEVSLLRKKLFDVNNDSIMELIRNPSSSSSLVICPEKKGNIARFLSGINNKDKSAKKKMNVNSSRYDIDGKVHVLLYSFKTIKKGEILYYDYNAGGSASYPTENFV